MLIIFLLANIALADIIVDDEQDLTFNFNLEDLEDRDDTVTITQEVTLTNDGSDDENLTLSFSDVDSDYSVIFTDSGDESFTLSAGSDQVIGLEIDVDISSGLDSDLYNGVFTLTVETDSGDSYSFDFNANLTPMLDLNKVKFTINDDSSDSMGSGDSNDGDIDLTVDPGDQVEITYDMDNLFDSSFREGDLDVTVTVTMDDRDWGEDIDEDTSFSIDASDSVSTSDEEYTIVFIVPDDARDDDNYELEISVEAQDGNGAKYNYEWIAGVEVARENDDVRIKSASVSPSSFTCGEDIAVVVNVQNYGSDNQKYTVVRVISDDLGIDEDTTFSLDEGYSSDNSETVRFDVETDDNVDLGDYQLTVRVYYDYDTYADVEYLDVTVDECGEEETTTTTTATTTATSDDEDTAEETTDEETAETTADDEDEDSITSSIITTTLDEDYTLVETIEKHFDPQEVAVGLIIVLVVLLFVTLIATLMVAAKPRKRRR